MVSPRARACAIEDIQFFSAQDTVCDSLDPGFCDKAGFSDAVDGFALSLLDGHRGGFHAVTIGFLLDLQGISGVADAVFSRLDLSVDTVLYRLDNGPGAVRSGFSQLLLQLLSFLFGQLFWLYPRVWH